MQIDISINMQILELLFIDIFRGDKVVSSMNLYLKVFMQISLILLGLAITSTAIITYISMEWDGSSIREIGFAEYRDGKWRVLFLTFLYENDRLALFHNIEGGEYTVSVVVNGLSTNYKVEWNGTTGDFMQLPTFIAPYTDWFSVEIVYSDFENENFIAPIVEASLYEYNRLVILRNVNVVIPYLVGVVLFLSILLTLGILRLKMLRYLFEEVLSYWKWLMMFVGLATLQTYMFYPRAFVKVIPNFPWPIRSYPDYPAPMFYMEVIPISSGIERLMMIPLITYVSLATLITVGYSVDKGFLVMDHYLGLDRTRIYISRFIVGYILVATPYIFSKFLADIYIYGGLPPVSYEYPLICVLRMGIHLYIILYLYMILYSLAIHTRSLSTSIPLLITPILVSQWDIASNTIRPLIQFPISLKALLVYSDQPILEEDVLIVVDGFTLNEPVTIILATLPFVLFTISWLIHIRRDIA